MQEREPVILAIDSAGAASAGTNFYIGNQFVWLTDIIPHADSTPPESVPELEKTAPGSVPQVGVELEDAFADVAGRALAESPTDALAAHRF